MFHATSVVSVLTLQWNVPKRNGQGWEHSLPLKCACVLAGQAVPSPPAAWMSPEGRRITAVRRRSAGEVLCTPQWRAVQCKHGTAVVTCCLLCAAHRPTESPCGTLRLPACRPACLPACLPACQDYDRYYPTSLPLRPPHAGPAGERGSTPALHCTALHCPALHCTSCTALRLEKVVSCTALHQGC